MDEEEGEAQGEGVPTAPTMPSLPHITPITPNRLPQETPLTLEEKKFLLAVERGDLATVRRSLDRARDTGYININCMDPLGRTALLMAIDNENLEMVELLLEGGVEIKDALLHAIHEEYVEAVEVLLDHEERLRKPGEPHSWEALDRDTATFTPDITPLILAAHRDNYEILKILLDRGATLPMPHDVRCGCEECVTSRQEDSLRHSRSRINAYRALASPSLIALSSKDPILTAFELSWELRRLSFLEHEFKNEYQDLRRQCTDFGTALLDHTRSSYELEVLLNHDPTGPAFEHGERMHLNRLKLAIKYKQKKFVSHPNVQQLLASLWYDGLPGFRRKNILLQTLEIVRIGFLFPVYSCVYVLLPHCRLGQTMRKPFIKFICHSASYVTFLFMLILASQRIETVVSKWFGSEPDAVTKWLGNADETNQHHSKKEPTKRGDSPSIVEWMIIAWVLGLIWNEIKQLWEDGLLEYVSDMWNIIDFTTNSLYVATIGLRIVAYFQVQKEIAMNTGTAYLPREEWDAWDPMLISEGLFSAANIFSSLKLVYIFSVNPHLGPLQICLGRMVIDILKFFFVYALVLFAFACGMNQLLWYYADMEKQKCYGTTSENGYESRIEAKNETDSCFRWRRFANLFESSQTLFWAAFGLIDLNNFELMGIKSYTRFWGMLMFGFYSVINIVVLLNLLIAMMNHSYQLISEKADIEWKFARSKLWMSYFEEGGTCPPPFNIIPTPKSFFYLCRWFYRKIYGQHSRSAKKEHLRTIRKKARQATERDIRYQGIMRNLVRRYVTVEQRKAENQGVTEDDVNEIKQDISSFRYELIEILKNSGMNTSIAADQPQGSGGKKGRQKERRLMKGFNIGLAECPSQEGSEGGRQSPVAKLVRLTRLAGLKQSSGKKRWGTVVEAARTLRHSIGRTRSEDSFGSGSSLDQISPRANSSVSDSNVSVHSEVGAEPPPPQQLQQQQLQQLHHNPAAPASTRPSLRKQKTCDSEPRPRSMAFGRLSALSLSNVRLKMPSFDEGKRGPTLRRLGQQFSLTGSLKSKAKRTTSAPAASPTASTKSTITTPSVASTLQVSSRTSSGGIGSKHMEPALTPIPSQHGSSNHSSPSPPATQSPSPPSPKRVKTASSWTHTGTGVVTCSPPATVSSPETLGCLTQSSSRDPLMSSSSTSVSSKPSNGSAVINRLPGVQPIGKHVPGGWL